MGRQYHQFCGVARALDVVGDRWTLLIIRDLLLGPMRFSDLLTVEQGIGPNLLTQRLKHLEAEGVLVSRQLPAPGRAKVYELTEWGRSLEPVVLGLGRFGAARLQQPGPQDRLHLGWAIFSFQRRFTGCDRSACIELWGAEQPYTLHLRRDGISVQRGEANGPDLRVRMRLESFKAWISKARAWPELVQGGLIELEGDEDAMRALSEGLGL